MTSRSRAATAFYLVVAAVLAGVLLEVFPAVLPDGLASRIGHNSEAYALVLVAAPWIQYARPRLAGTSREWPVTAGVAVLCLVAGLLLLASDLPSRFRTLNETFLALALLLPYLQLRRPLPRYVAGGLAAVVLAGVVLFNRTAVVTDLAETFGILLLAPIAFDLVDRGILDPVARTSARLRWSWYAVLAVVPLCLSVLEYRVGIDGLAGEAVRYGVRVTEAFVALLLIELFLAVLLGRRGRPGEGAPPARVPAGAAAS